MNRMVAEGARNPKSVGTKLESRGFWGEQALKEEEKRATGDLLQERTPI
jgi:hypothetical protein